MKMMKKGEYIIQPLLLVYYTAIAVRRVNIFYCHCHIHVIMSHVAVVTICVAMVTLFICLAKRKHLLPRE